MVGIDYYHCKRLLWAFFTFVRINYRICPGKKEEDTDLMTKLASYFRPEFMNRFNGIVEFSHLTKYDLGQIVDLMLNDVNRTSAKKDITLMVTYAVKDYLEEQGYDEAMGVRPLRRVIEQQIRDKVTDFYLDNQSVKALKADIVDNQIVIMVNED